METLTLIYDKGHMTLNLREFFPCKIDVAKKIFPLINRWASWEECDALMDYLMERYGNERNAMKAYKERADSAERDENKQKQKYYMALYRQTDVLQKRFKRNIEILVGGGRDR